MGAKGEEEVSVGERGGGSHGRSAGRVGRVGGGGRCPANGVIIFLSRLSVYTSLEKTTYVISFDVDLAFKKI